MTITIPAVKINNQANSTKCYDFSYDLSNEVNHNPSFGTNIKTHTVSEPVKKLTEFFGRRSTPMNRLILGATALIFQPWIDLHNNDVDKKTRKASWARTIAKNIAGVATGIPIRYLCIKSIESVTKTPDELKKAKKTRNNWNSLLIPDEILKDGDWIKYSGEEFGNALRLVRKHREAIGSTVALVVMLFTNFALDVPITKYLTNKLIDKDEAKSNEKINAKGGNS